MPENLRGPQLNSFVSILRCDTVKQAWADVSSRQSLAHSLKLTRSLTVRRLPKAGALQRQSLALSTSRSELERCR